ncbi:MAG: EamA family transporter [Oscillospiraceae bacterium]|nr:EamA family transporter [Oscillospiraceae bacterium]
MGDPAEASLCGGSNRWIIWGLVSPTLQAVSNILAKLDSTPVSVSLTTCIRVLVVALVLSIIAIIKEGSGLKLQHQDKGKLLYLILGGCILGVSYLLMYSAIYSGIAAVVTPIVKSNIIVTTVLANIFLDERLSRRGWAGFAIVCAGLVFFLF